MACRGQARGVHSKRGSLLSGNQPANEPAEQKVLLHLLHQFPFGADRDQDLDQANADQPFRRNRGKAKVGVERLKLGVQPGQRLIHHLPDFAQRMPGGNARLKIDIAEQLPARLVRSTHDHLWPTITSGDFKLYIGVPLRAFYQRVRCVHPAALRSGLAGLLFLS
jgi:hypothetical protein